MDNPTFISLLEKAIDARKSLFDAGHQAAFRLFNGFTEGNPNLVIDCVGHDPHMNDLLNKKLARKILGASLFVHSSSDNSRGA